MSKRLTTAEFIEKAKKVHGDRYDYSKTEYIGNKDKVHIICPDHGGFWQTPSDHMSGRGCLGCRNRKISASKMSNTEDFIKKSKKLHGDKYNYDSVEYIRCQDEVKLKCELHGYFTVTPMTHLQGTGCPECGAEKCKNIRRSNINEFIKMAKSIHGKKYGYDNTVYINSKTKVTVTCDVHGDFMITPNHHLRGVGCAECGSMRSADSSRSNTAEFIRKATKIHGTKYLYSNVEYTGAMIAIKITCSKHGDFVMLPNSHLNGQGCPECGRENSAAIRRSNTEEFIRKAAEIHENKYNYKNTEYIDSTTKVNVSCQKHGEYWQTPHDHLKGAGCPVCGVTMSKQEIAIGEFLSRYINTVSRDRRILEGKEIDIVIEPCKLGIEYNGSIWHSEKYSRDPIWHMRKKQIECEAKGYRLIHIADTDNTAVVKKMLLRAIGKCEKLHARKLTIIKTTSNDNCVAEFYRDNHLQGNAAGCTVYALVDNSGTLKAAMSFSNVVSIRGMSDNSTVELRRFASEGTVIGGASRLLKAFIRESECETIISYSHNKWFTGDMYKKIGFNMCNEIQPDYMYIREGFNKKPIPKNHFKREKLAKIPGFDFNPDESEHQNCLRNGWYRIYDCGKKKWVMEIKR